MRHDEARAVFQHLRDRVLNELLRLRIDGARRLVEHKDARVGKDHAGKGNELLFARGKAHAAFAHLGIIAMLLPENELLRVHHARRRADFLIRCRLSAITDVIRNGAGKQVRRLQHIAKAVLKPELAAFAVIPPVDAHLPFRRFIEAAHKVYDGAFSCARFTHKGNRLAGLHMQVEIREHFLAALVGKGNVFELHLAADLLPVFPLRVEAVAIFCDDFRRIRDIARSVDERDHALRAGLRALQLRKDARKLLHRLKEVHGVGNERGKRAEADRPHQDRVAAAVERKPGADGAKEHDDRHKDGREHRRAHGSFPHLAGQFTELAVVLFLAHKGFRRHRAHDAFIKGTRDARIRFAHAALVFQDLLLEIHRNHRKRRDHDKSEQRKFPVQHEH